MGLTMVCTTLFSSCGGGGGGDSADSTSPYTIFITTDTGAEYTYELVPSSEYGEGTVMWKTSLTLNTSTQLSGSYEWYQLPDADKANDAQQGMLKVRLVDTLTTGEQRNEDITFTFASDSGLKTAYASSSVKIYENGRYTSGGTLTGTAKFSAVPH